MVSRNAGKTVREILEGKRASIKNAPLEQGAPAWDDILDLTWEQIARRASQRKPGYQAIRKLLADRRFDK